MLDLTLLPVVVDCEGDPVAMPRASVTSHPWYR
jgi:hypothetical protein